MICALIQNNLVVGVIDLTEDQTQLFGSVFEQIIDVTNYIPQPQIGWAFDGINISGSNVSLKITRLAMNQRFTTTEMLTIMTYVNANPASVAALLLQRLSISTYIDLSRSDTQAGLAYLVSVSLLTSPRATVIGTTIPSPIELYQG